jgi:hypothetical protein
MFQFFRSRANDAITSFKSAASAKDLAIQHQEVIVACLKRFGPLGKDGIASHTGLQSNQVARRLKELQTLGFIQLTGKEVMSDSLRKEREWAFVPTQGKLL